MTDLFWPGDERAGEIFSPAGLLAAMVRVEAVWLDTLVNAGVFPQQAADRLDDLVFPEPTWRRSPPAPRPAATR